MNVKKQYVVVFCNILTEVSICLSKSIIHVQPHYTWQNSWSNNSSCKTFKDLVFFIWNDLVLCSGWQFDTNKSLIYFVYWAVVKTVKSMLKWYLFLYSLTPTNAKSHYNMDFNYSKAQGKSAIINRINLLGIVTIEAG